MLGGAPWFPGLTTGLNRLLLGNLDGISSRNPEPGSSRSERRLICCGMCGWPWMVRGMTFAEMGLASTADPSGSRPVCLVEASAALFTPN